MDHAINNAKKYIPGLEKNQNGEHLLQKITKGLPIYV